MSRRQSGENATEKTQPEGGLPAVGLDVGLGKEVFPSSRWDRRLGHLSEGRGHPLPAILPAYKYEQHRLPREAPGLEHLASVYAMVLERIVPARTVHEGAAALFEGGDQSLQALAVRAHQSLAVIVDGADLLGEVLSES